MKKIFICAITIALGLTSCSNEETQISNNVSLEEKADSGILVKEAINETFDPTDPNNNTSYRDVLKYKPNTKKLESIITYNTVDNSIFREAYYTYKGNLLTDIESYENDQLSFTFEYFYKNDKISKIINNQYDPKSTSEKIIESYVLTYKHLNNGNIKIKTKTLTGEGDEEALFVIKSGNVVEVKKSLPGDQKGFYSQRAILSYDNTINPYRKITGFSKIINEFEDSKNNLASAKFFSQKTPDAPIEEFTNKTILKYDNLGRIIENSILEPDGVTVSFKRRFSY